MLEEADAPPVAVLGLPPVPFPPDLPPPLAPGPHPPGPPVDGAPPCPAIPGSLERTDPARDAMMILPMRGLASFTLLFFLSANVWAASPPSDEVKAQVRKATGEYNLGQYLEAAKDYEAAYLQTLDPNLLFNVAQAYRLAGEADKAITAYRSFLRSNPRGEQRGVAEAKLRELEEKRAAAPAAPAVPMAPVVGPAPAVTTQPPPAAPAMAPAPAASMTAAIRPASEDANVLVTAPASEPPKSAAFYKGWPFWVVTGAVVAGVVVAAVVLSSGGNDLKMPNATLGTKEY
jgi:hypothetical protein